MTAAVDKLIAAMEKEDRDFTVVEIYFIACRAPHRENLSLEQLRGRVSRYVGEARRILKIDGSGRTLVPGDTRSSYRIARKNTPWRACDGE